jgi:hypothetical protein
MAVRCVCFKNVPVVDFWILFTCTERLSLAKLASFYNIIYPGIEIWTHKKIQRKKFKKKFNIFFSNFLTCLRYVTT